MFGKSVKIEGISNFAERRLSDWEKHKKEAKPAHDGIEYITISRELGSGGEEIANHLAELAGWDMYDKEILDYMSENMDVRVKTLESVDEQTIGWMNDWLIPFFTSKSNEHVEQLSYYKHLSKVLLVIAQHGKAIIIGRAAGQFLPREKGLSVRIIAPFEARCERYAKENNISSEEAAAIVKKSDTNQQKFLKDFLHKDINDFKHYDIVINTEKLDIKPAARLLWRALDQRVLSQQEHQQVKKDGIDIERIVEHQMQQWSQQQQDHSEEVDTHAHLTSGANIDYITVAREIGSGAAEIARMLSDLMNWQLYDKKILDYMSDNMNVHIRLLTSVDENTLGWIGDRLVTFFSTKKSSHLQWRYYEHLGQVLLVIAEHGRAVIVGRAAGMILPREKGLRVCVIAPYNLRCKRYAKENNIPLEKARSIVKKADREHKKFVKDFITKDVNDPLNYDIICNTEILSPTSVAKLIFRAFEQRELHEQDQQPQQPQQPQDQREGG